MCGRVAQYMSWAEIYELLSYRGPQPPVEIVPRYNIPPDTSLQVLLDAGGTLLPSSTRWGWAPHWATDRRRPSNARADQVASSPFWRIAWPHRMLTPINGWFEWTGEKGNKKPWFIRRRDGQLTLCATVGQVHHEEPQPGDGVAIITAASTGGMVDIHDRRPVAFTPELAREWLDPATTRERARDMLEHGEGPEVFEWFRVDVAANNARNDGPQILTPETTKGPGPA